jgi:hypothetical protein
MPITRQFFLPFLPIASWLVLYWSCRYVIIDRSPMPSIRTSHVCQGRRWSNQSLRTNDLMLCGSV